MEILKRKPDIGMIIYDTTEDCYNINIYLDIEEEAEKHGMIESPEQVDDDVDEIDSYSE